MKFLYTFASLFAKLVDGAEVDGLGRTCLGAGRLQTVALAVVAKSAFVRMSTQVAASDDAEGAGGHAGGAPVADVSLDIDVLKLILNNGARRASLMARGRQAMLAMEDLDLGDVAVEAVERMSPLAEIQKVKLEMGELPEIHTLGDRQYLVQMISNLIENGIKYSGSGRRVRIELGSINNNGKDLATLSISDTGPGIEPDHLPRIFDRFYRIDAARSRDDDDSSSTTGSGLGLSIVSWIVKVHGGEIHVTSKVNEGSTFVVTLPAISE